MGEVDADRGGRLRADGGHVRGVDRLLLRHRPRRHRRRGGLRPGAGHPAAGRVARSTTRDAGSSTSPCRRATPTSAATRRPRPGASTAPTSARRCGRRAARRCWSTSPTAGRGEHPALARHAPAGRDGRRPAPDDRRRGHLVAHLADRPAGGHPLVPPAPARGDRRARLPRGGGDVHPRRPRGERRWTLPRKYGVDDIPVIVQDKEFDGIELDTTPGLFESNGILGDTVLVNGTPGPYLDVTTERVRLRLLNASNARVYNFHFADDREYDVIASDGGLLPAPVRLDHLLLSPGERAEIVVAVEPGETTVLRSDEQDAGNRFTGADDRLDILQLRAGRPAGPFTRGAGPARRRAGPRPGRRGRDPRVRAPRHLDQRRRDGHGPHRRDRRAGHHRTVAGRATPTAARTTSTSTTCSS